MTHSIRRFGLAVLALGCGHAQLQPTAAQPQRIEPAAPASSRRPLAAKPEPNTPVFSRCVLHAGDAEKHTLRVRHADGTQAPPVVSGKCWFNAECVQDPRRATPGDGDVGLQCDGRACVCEYRPITPAGPVVRTQFELLEDCTSDTQAEQLLRERCMAAMTVAPASH